MFKNNNDTSAENFCGKCLKKIRRDARWTNFEAYVRTKKGSINISNRMTNKGRQLENPLNVLKNNSDFFPKMYIPSTLHIIVNEDSYNCVEIIDSFKESNLLVALERKKTTATIVKDVHRL